MAFPKNLVTKVINYFIWKLVSGSLNLDFHIFYTIHTFFYLCLAVGSNIKKIFLNYLPYLKTHGNYGI